MPVDPHIDYLAHDPEDGEELSDDPKIREAQELEARMRRALATKENPLSDSESTSERLRRLEREGAPSAESAESAEPSGDSEPES
ncbi:hypothetical protein [Brachybacterium paraconglomeratum]|uniref:hypothetical protein n=1 Tax=Brachybacterium paraconglomeratum TaxID=173362 RepID=UPI0022E44509|nr:hypothetical protein [Brachybacterium paraconglomeratum]